MKTRKLLARLRDLLDADHTQQMREMDPLREVLRELGAKQRKLQSRLQQDPAREDLEEIAAKLEALYRQRVKGIARLCDLRGHGPGAD